jgi:signal transduction histidine kinase
VGLGLSIVAKIIDDHRGTIRLEVNPPHGARFHVFFPQAGQ